MIRSFFLKKCFECFQHFLNSDSLILEGISHPETKVTSSSDKSGAIPRKRVAIYGGTFDPPTNSHMNLGFGLPSGWLWAAKWGKKIIYVHMIMKWSVVAFCI